MTSPYSHFVDELAEKHGVSKTGLLKKFLEFKTRAVKGNSKSRRNWAAVYTISVICEDYVAGQKNGSSSTSLLRRIRQKPYGSKLQNHHLDNRLNGEFKKKYRTDLEIMDIDGSNRQVSEAILGEAGDKPEAVAKFAVDVVATYASIIAKIEIAFLTEISSANTQQDILKTIVKAFNATSDARVFEIVSFAILHLSFKKIKASFSTSSGEIETSPLMLYKTGRTNANDGGIDFVLKPIGKFFQVTEGIDFKKYFLDFDKVNRFPLSFVVKTSLSVDEVQSQIRLKASREMDELKVELYMSLFEDIYTLNELNDYLRQLSTDNNSIEQLKQIIINCYKLEFSLSD
ncbi:hypothetical protein [Pseudoalteromonas peptidolytica]|uniref:hypothetical protein n=1 Tax=Pseudoalteromonas peptidolytica TaxID=61150 RepID=UPI00298D7EE6|nr:hypothetical protein [Pseudoalteromonas peptidolytica]MDW7549334.1 hypothetical protein [Pseudoalteromonas peptidolytica]